MKRLLALSLAVSGCVTTHQSYEIESVKTPTLVMSCNERRDLTAAYFHVVGCTFENTGGDWLDVEVESVSLEGPVEVHVSTPEEIQAFVEASEFRREKDAYNASTATAAMALVGLAVIVAGGSNATPAGAAITSSALGIRAGRDTYDGWAKAQNVEPVYSKNHVLVKGLRLPPGEFTRKFVLLETKAFSLPPVVKVCLAKPQTECLDLPMRRS